MATALPVWTVKRFAWGVIQNVSAVISQYTDGRSQGWLNVAGLFNGALVVVDDSDPLVIVATGKVGDQTATVTFTPTLIMWEVADAANASLSGAGSLPTARFYDTV